MWIVLQMAVPDWCSKASQVPKKFGKDIESMDEIYIEGTITLNDKKVKFSVSNEESWFQWGNSEEILYETMPITEAIQKTINEDRL